MIALATTSIAWIIMGVVVVGWIVYALLNAGSARKEVGAEIELAPNRKPYYDDEVLEGRRLERVQLRDETQVFNTELVAALELANMLDIAETILQSALQREESRGAHQRTDFNARDDTRFLNHALAYREADGAVRIERSPVTITRWPPGERVYGR